MDDKPGPKKPVQTLGELRDRLAKGDYFGRPRECCHTKHKGGCTKFAEREKMVRLDSKP